MMPVEIGERVVLKSGVPGLAVEAAKLDAYRKAGGDAFEVPQVIDFNQRHNTLSMGLLSSFDPLVSCYLSGSRESGEVFRLTGVALARIHAVSGVDQAWVQQLDRAGDRSTGPLLLHGDYGFSNVGVIRRSARLRLVVFDPSPDRINVTAPTQRGWPIDDMAVMLSCILGRVPFTRLPSLVRVRRRQLAESFFRGYCEISPPGCTIEQAVTRGQALLFRYLTIKRGVPVRVARAAARTAAAGIGPSTRKQKSR